MRIHQSRQGHHHGRDGLGVEQIVTDATSDDRVPQQHPDAQDGTTREQGDLPNLRVQV
ncbi:hypothetical protein [Nocardia farcinica]|uniref:hypothetical protein n=1 Tax=Nocardia farcinica TaxID=37329 RepID=UPI002455C1FD|nr:hypothetical protein [Nocardia farcinica]